MPVGRRRFLRRTIGVLASAAAFRLRHAFAAAVPAPESLGPAPLKDRAAAKGLRFGAAIGRRGLGDPELTAAIVRECGLVVPENEGKMAVLRPSIDRFDFGALDRLIALAGARDIAVRGHTLVWHNAVPGWLEEKLGELDRAGAERLLREHVTGVLTHTRGAIRSWDVVNEAVALEQSRPDGLRYTPWLKVIGPEYIDIAFQAAHEADPTLELVYNDYGLDYAERSQERRREAVLALIDRLLRRSVPVHALGLQGHLAAEGLRFGPGALREFLREVAARGLAIHVTELDIADKMLPADEDLRDRRVADMAARYLDVVLDERATRDVLTWGLSDRHSWLNTFPPRKRSDGLLTRGLPLDERMQRKLFWSALARAFDNAPAR